MSKIVFIDDEQDICELFNEFFSEFYYDVNTFTEVEKAIEFCITEKPQLVFVDFRLKDCLGHDVARRLNPDSKKVLLTGELDVNTDFKFDRVMQKPFKLREMLSLVEELLS